MGFWGFSFCLIISGFYVIISGIFYLNFFLSLYFINRNSDKNKFLTHDSYVKIAIKLKYSRPNLGNQNLVCHVWFFWLSFWCQSWLKQTFILYCTRFSAFLSGLKATLTDIVFHLNISSGHFYVVIYGIKWVTTSWTYSTIYINNYLKFFQLFMVAAFGKKFDSHIIHALSGS